MTGRAGSSLRRGERGDLVERAFGEHRVEARVDARVERLALGGEEQAGPGAGRQGGGLARAPWKAASGRPVAATTSSARNTRWRSLGLSRAAVSGSRRRECACSAGVGSAFGLGAHRARTASGTRGMSDRPSVRARK